MWNNHLEIESNGYVLSLEMEKCHPAQNVDLKTDCIYRSNLRRLNKHVPNTYTDQPNVNTEREKRKNPK